jgi:hypothetical protein
MKVDSGDSTDNWHMAYFIDVCGGGGYWRSGLEHGLSVEHGDDWPMAGALGRQGARERRGEAVLGGDYTGESAHCRDASCLWGAGAAPWQQPTGRCGEVGRAVVATRGHTGEGSVVRKVILRHR